MGILLRSAIVIGAIVYLAPLRYGQAPALPELPKPDAVTSAEKAQALWEKLPASAKQAVTEELGKRLDAAAPKPATPQHDRKTRSVAPRPGDG